MSIVMQTCVKCARSMFPPRSLCPHCHNSSFVPTTAYRGVVEEVSVLRGLSGTRYASIRTDLGPVVVGKVLGDGCERGAEIELASDEKTHRADGLIAMIPQPDIKE